MLRNYLVVAMRNLLRHKLYAAINVIGLSVGMASCGLILLYIAGEIRFDDFHTKADRTYRVLRETRDSRGSLANQAGTSGPLGPALLESFPQVEQVVQASGYGDELWTSQGVAHHRHAARRVWRVTPNFLTVFDFPLVWGNAETALEEPYSMVMSEAVARAYLGVSDPIGRKVQVESSWAAGEYTVQAVLRISETSSLQFDVLFSSQTPSPSAWLRRQWENWQTENRLRPVQTFVVLRSSQDASAVTAGMPDLIERHMGAEARQTNRYLLQPITRIHLHASEDYGSSAITGDADFLGVHYGDVRQIHTLSAIAVLVLVIACANFMNLATARSSKRAMEVGIRKVSGARRYQVAARFLGESLLVTLLSVLLALAALGLALPRLESLLNVSLDLEANVGTVIGIGTLAILVGLLAGIYPAFVLSGSTPSHVLKGESARRSRSGLWKILVVAQFGITILLVIGTMTVRRQVDHLQSHKLGFDDEHLIQMPVFRLDRTRKSEDFQTHLARQYRTVKQAFLGCAGVLSATAHREVMGIDGGVPRAIRLQDGTALHALMQEADGDFLSTYGIDLIEGRTFAEMESEGQVQFVVNEEAVRQSGMSDPIGRILGYGTVVGVMRDANSRPLREAIGPLIIRNRTLLNYLTVRIKGDDIPGTLEALEGTWRQFLPDRPFEYTFLDEALRSMYEPERRLGQLVGLFSALAVIVACLGLFGLSAHTVEQRTKEIGVRKVLGASLSSILVQLSWRFVYPVAVANLLAWPLAYLAMSHWLEGFPYRIGLEAWVFAASGCMAVSVALLTVGYQACRSATANPVDALKYE